MNNRNKYTCRKKGASSCKNGSGKGRKGDLGWQAGCPRDGGDQHHHMNIIIICMITIFTVSKMAATSVYDDILRHQVNFCLAVMDTGVNMVAFARMDTCPVSIFSPFFLIFQK